MILPSATVTVRPINTGETYPLRLAVLRPNRPAEAAHFPGDDEASTRHFGAFLDGQCIGIASLFRAELIEKPGIPAFQLRGMATAQEAQRRGVGRTLLRACLDYASANGAAVFWCNARISAIDFYRKNGLVVVSGEFEVPDVGPHVRMAIDL
jgi:GNAT superfamily N-acetyltransferase